MAKCIKCEKELKEDEIYLKFNQYNDDFTIIACRACVSGVILDYECNYCDVSINQCDCEFYLKEG
jgi:hypothetical protein